MDCDDMRLREPRKRAGPVEVRITLDMAAASVQGFQRGTVQVEQRYPDGSVFCFCDGVWIGQQSG